MTVTVWSWRCRRCLTSVSAADELTATTDARRHLEDVHADTRTDPAPKLLTNSPRPDLARYRHLRPT